MKTNKLILLLLFIFSTVSNAQINIEDAEKTAKDISKLDINNLTESSKQLLMGKTLRFPSIQKEEFYDNFIYVGKVDTIWHKQRKRPKPTDYELIKEYKGILKYQSSYSKTYATPSSALSEKEFKIVNITLGTSAFSTGVTTYFLEDIDSKEGVKWTVLPYRNSELTEYMVILEHQNIIEQLYLNKIYYLSRGSQIGTFIHPFQNGEQVRCTSVRLRYSYKGTRNIYLTFTSTSKSGVSGEADYDNFFRFFETEEIYNQKMAEAKLKAEQEKAKLDLERKKVKRAELYEQRYGKIASEERRAVKYPSLTNSFSKVYNAPYWSYNQEIGKWESGKLTPNSANGIYWFQWNSLKEDNVDYKVLIWEENDGHFRYPAIYEGWVSYRKKRFFIITDEEFETMKNILLAKQDTVITVSSRMNGSNDNYYEPYSERRLMSDIVNSIYHTDMQSLTEYLAEYITEYLSIKLITIKGVKYIRFLMPYNKREGSNSFNSRYYELPYMSFMNSMHPPKN